MRISSLQNYVPSYPEIKHMSEAEMLIVKNVIDRAKKFPNTAHHEAVISLVEVLCERLNITETIPDPIAFLRTVINDYIVLTR